MTEMIAWGGTWRAAKTSWSYGKPPCVGWWETHFPLGSPAFRYWDGQSWSHFIRSGGGDRDFFLSLEVANKKSQFGTQDIEWRGLTKPSAEWVFRKRLKTAIKQAMKECSE